MSRTDHKLRCVEWLGNFARWFTNENRDWRRWGRKKRERAERRLERRATKDQVDK